MNTISTENPAINPQDTRNADAGINAIKNYMGWLREWEQAQWQTAQQNKTDIAAAKIARESPGSTGRGPVYRAADGLGRQAASSNPGGLLPTAVPAGLPAVVTGTASAGPQISPMPSNAILSTYCSLVPVFYQHASSVSLPEPTPLSVFRLADPAAEWQPFLLHVLPGDAGVRVWIRDRRFYESSTQDLLIRLRVELAAQGMKLASLTVNGREVWRAADLNDRNQSSPDGNIISTLDRTY